MQLLKKMELKHWRELSKERLDQIHQDLSDNWKTSTIGEMIQLKERDLKDLKDLTPEAIKFSYDFSVAIQEHNNQKVLEIFTKIEQLDTIWRAE